MGLVSLILALLVEQWRPLPSTRIARPLGAWADFVEEHFNAGEYRHGVIGWCLVVLPLAAAGWALYAAAYAVHPLLALGVNVAALYSSLGFREGAHRFAAIQDALKAQQIDRARAVLSQWRGEPYADLAPGDVARLAIETALTASHRHVFGVMLWFLVLPGPSGALAYRAAAFLAVHWNEKRRDLGAFGRFAADAFAGMDWLPVRVTALAFAVVGDFEDAVYCWRTQAARWLDPLLGIVLASGAGAMGVRLGMPIPQEGVVEDRPEIGLGDDADAAFLDSTLGLIWRALVLWLAMLAVIGIARMVT
jgi:cobalamin biosynthesis protein CobD/CbiB